MSFLPFPATTTSEAVALIKQDGAILHDIVHGDQNTEVLTENGLVPSVNKVLSAMNYKYLDPLTFTTGATLNSNIEALRRASDGEYFRWSGTVPKVVAPNTDPISDPLYISVGSAALRNDLQPRNGIKELRPLVGLAQVVKGFYPNNTSGGGVYVYEPTRPKSDHNGGTIIAPEALTLWDGNQSTLTTLVDWAGSGNGCYVRESSDAIYPEFFGLFGGGALDDTVALRAAFKALQTSSVSKIKFQGKKDVLITDKVLLRAADKTIDGTGIRILLGSSQAGLQFAGDRIKIIGFRGEQTSQSYTPTLIYIFNDATTKRSSFCKVIGVTGYSLYRGIHMYMGDNSSGAACYRHSLYDCEFINQYQQKTWAGSFGISFDGPFGGDAGGNDSKCVNCLVTGYESNYVINNSIATQFVTCSGDGALYCFYYSGLSSGLRIVGGYYEYNTHLIGVNGVKYDAYLLYPSVSNTISTQITGEEISYISGGWTVGLAATTPISNGAFTTSGETGKSEVYSVNGHTFYSGASKTSRGGLNADGDWVFTPATTFSVSGVMNIDTIRGYTGGAVPLRIVNTSASSGAKVVFGTNSIDRVEVSSVGNFRPTTDVAVSLGEPSNRWSTVYAQTGTINTSDERDKLEIKSIESSEKATALEIKQHIKKFKFKDAVSSKGEKARIHFGVGAQTVKAIFEKHGLNGFDYAVLCYDEWVDEAGISVNKYGIRYDELSMFLLAAI